MVNAAAIREVRAYLTSGQVRAGCHRNWKTSCANSVPPRCKIRCRDGDRSHPLFSASFPAGAATWRAATAIFATLGRASRSWTLPRRFSAIDFMAEYCEKRGQKNYQIQLFGGEPFVEDRVVDVVVHHARFIASRTGVSPSFVVSTNGLFGPARRQFVGDYFDRVVLSLDGFREFHDRNRPISADRPSFDEVVATARYLSTARAQLCLRCCVTSESVLHLESIARWFCEEFHPVVVNFEPMTESPESRAAGLAPPAPHDFARHALRSWQVLRSRNCEPASAPILTDGLQNTSCPVGRTR